MSASRITGEGMNSVVNRGTSLRRFESTMKKINRKAVLAAAATTSIMWGFPQAGHAATYFWSGTANTSITNPANWGGTTPTGTDIACWNSSSYSTVPAIGTAITFGEMLFDVGNTNTLSFATGTQTITLNGVMSGGVNYGIVNNGAGTVTPAVAKFKVGSSQTWLNSVAGNTLTMAGTLQNSTSAASTITIDGAGNFTSTGIISNGVSMGALGFIKNGTGTLKLSNNNTYTGGMVINNGTVTTDDGRSFNQGSGSITLGDTGGSNNATLEFTGTGATNGVLATPITVRTGSAGTLMIQGNTNTNSITGNITLNNNVTLNEAAGKTITFSGLFTGGSGQTITIPATMSPTATVVLNHDNSASLSSSIALNAGTLNFSSNALGTGTVTLGGGVLQYATGNTQTLTGSRFASSGGNAAKIDLNGNAVALSNAIGSSVSGGLTVSSSASSSGSLTLTGSQQYTGLTTVSSGTLKLAGDGASSIKSGNALAVSASSFFDINGNGQTLGTVNNAGTITNSGASTTLTIGDGSSGAGAFTGNMNLAWDQGASSSTLNGSWTNSGNVTLSANGTGNLTAGAIANSGSLTLNANAAAGISVGAPSNAGAITNSGTNSGSATISGAIGSSVTSVNQNSSTSMLILSGTNTNFTNALNIQQGTVQVGSATAVGGGVVTIGSIGNSATLDLNGQTETIKSLATAGTAANQTIINNSGSSNATLSYAGAGATTFAGLIKDGSSKTTAVNVASGTLTLTGNNSYSGGTTVASGGTLAVQSVTALGSGPLSFTAGTIKSADGAAKTIANPISTITTGVTFAAGGDLIFSSTGTATASAMTVTTNNNTTLAGSLSGNSYTFGGTGKLTLLGTIGSSNNQTISNGATVQIGDGTSADLGGWTGASVKILNDGTLIFNRAGSGSITYNQVISTNGTGTITKQGAGTVLLAAGSTLQDLNVQAGTFAFPASSGTHFIKGNTTISAGATMGNTGTTVEVTGHALTMYGTPGNNAYLTVASGGMSFTSITAGAGTYANQIVGTTGSAGSLIYRGAGSATLPVSIQDTIGTGSFKTSLKIESGTLLIDHANTFSGEVYLDGGELDISNALALGTSSNLRSSPSGVFDNTSGNAMTITQQPFINSTNDNLHFKGSSDLTVGQLSFSAQIPSIYTITVDSHNLTFNGGMAGGNAANSLMIKAGNGTLTLAGVNNSSTGGMNLRLDAGQLNLNAANALIGSANRNFTLNINGGNLDNTSAGDVSITSAPAYAWNADFAYVGSVHSLNLGTGGVTLGNNRQVTVSNNTLTVGGNITGGSFTLTKLGTGTLALNGSNTYGASIVSAGTLLAGSANALPSASDVTIGGGTLDVSGFANTVHNLTLNSGALNLGIGNKLSTNTAAFNGGTVNVSGTGTSGTYQLLTATSPITFSSVAGTVPASYRLSVGSSELDLIHKATIGTITATPTNNTIITGGTTTFGIAVANSAPSGSDNLSFTASAGSNTSGSIGSPVSVGAGSTSALQSGLSFTSATVGTAVTGTFTVSDSNATTTAQTGSVSVKVLDHSNAALAIASGNNQTIITGGTAPTVTLTLSNSGTGRSALDVNTLNNLTGSTGSAVVASNSSGTYTVTNTSFDTTTLGQGKTLATSLFAGDQQALSGANGLSQLSQTVTYSVLGHSNAALSIVSGNNQTIIMGGTLAPVTLNLTNSGTGLSALDVSNLSHLTGTTGSAVVASGGTGSYTASGFVTVTAGSGRTLIASADAGDQQTLSGATALSTLSQTVSYDVLSHSNAGLSVASGNSQSIITGGSLAPVTVNLTNVATGNTHRSPLDVANLANLSGQTGAAVVPSGGSVGYTVDGTFDSVTVGLSKTLAVSLDAGDQQSLSGATALVTKNSSVTYSVYDHANPLYTPVTLDLGTVHVGYGVAATSNTFAIQNGIASSENRVALKGSGSGTNSVSLATIASLANNGTTTSAMKATLAKGVTGGTLLDQSITYTFGDASTLSGNNPTLSTPSFAVTGAVFSGNATWNDGNGSYSTPTQWSDDANSAIHAAPGTYTAFKTTDQATFSGNGGTITLDGAVPSLNNLVFGGSHSYALNTGTDSGYLTMAGTSPSVSVTGTHAIGANMTFAGNTTVTVSPGSSMTFNGGLNKSGTVLTFAGGGHVVVNNVISSPTDGGAFNSDLVVNTPTDLNAAGTYSGPTYINSSGILNIGINDAIPTSSPVTITGGTLNTATYTSTVASLTMTDGSITGAGSVTAGSLSASGSNTISSTVAITGTTTVNGGATLNVSGVLSSASVSVDPTATLEGTGTINAPVTITGTGIISPAGTGVIGTLSASSLTVAGTYLADIAGASSADVLNVSGLLDLTGGSLQVSPSALTGSVYVIAHYGTRIGEFGATSGMPDNATIDYNYLNSNEIAIVTIPEPSAVAMVLGLSGLLAAGRRRRQANA